MEQLISLDQDTPLRVQPSLHLVGVEKFPEEAELTGALDNKGLLSNVQWGIPVNCTAISIMSTALSLVTSNNIVANVTFSSEPK